MATGTDATLRGVAAYRGRPRLIVRAQTTIAANTATAISRNHVREPKPRDAAFGGDACEGCCATRPYLDGLFARFRFLAKAIDDAQVGRAKRHA
jgi:hypothetical protein